MNTVKTGHLIVAGTGPGNPESLTLKVKNEIEAADILFVPKSELKNESLALKIASPFIKAEQNVRELVYPMSRDQGKLKQYWKQAGSEVGSWLKEHPQKKAVYLTLGDPSIYSTWSYLKQALLDQGFCSSTWTILPGISSFSYGAAILGKELCIGQENFCLINMPQSLESLQNYTQLFQKIVVMKIGKQWDTLRKWLKQLALDQYTFVVTRAGLENQGAKLLAEIPPGTIEYLSLAIIDVTKEMS
ncbi:MAG: precorrin-2 C(20)-methyltransferase [Spirochaetales bacterium]|nr:precorrin-2 C(20)-methyltransferase [Spirochaetales bacterium]